MAQLLKGPAEFTCFGLLNNSWKPWRMTYCALCYAAQKFCYYYLPCVIVYIQYRAYIRTNRNWISSTNSLFFEFWFTYYIILCVYEYSSLSLTWNITMITCENHATFNAECWPSCENHVTLNIGCWPHMRTTWRFILGADHMRTIWRLILGADHMWESHDASY